MSPVGQGTKRISAAQYFAPHSALMAARRVYLSSSSYLIMKRQPGIQWHRVNCTSALTLAGCMEVMKMNLERDAICHNRVYLIMQSTSEPKQRIQSSSHHALTSQSHADMTAYGIASMDIFGESSKSCQMCLPAGSFAGHICMRFAFWPLRQSWGPAAGLPQSADADDLA